MFSGLFNIAIGNSHIVYKKLGSSICVLDFKITVAKLLIGRYSHRQQFFPLSRTSKPKALESSLPKEQPTRMPYFFYFFISNYILRILDGHGKISSFEIAHDNQVRVKMCYDFRFTSNKSIIQDYIISVVYHWVTGDPKIISETKSAMEIGPKLKYFTSEIW